ncbi:hypothetical protein LFT45_06655 [Arthrobacter sp. FW305-BF8]|uniref:hypothetical protein n=1 Tax=Arthrobacter sp. FW305-BF8 TaxID=2879617 RepID=UPI001F25748B|nr:hypothetical protein [Arthrobacter sp. FW305-BF8]UKA55594.1 hypothetical protein LFT45_06655 [Arthrobacter sp. FW305-BF8]
MTIAALSWSTLRPLRPVLLAGAAAAAWLAVSAPAADADNSHLTDSLGGSISSTVSSVEGSTDSVAGTVGALVSATAREAGTAAQPAPAVVPLPLPAADPAALPASLPATVTPAPAEQPPAVAPPPVTPVPSTPAPPAAVVAPVVASIVEPVDAALGGLPLGETLPDDTLAGVTGPVASVADGALTDAAETIAKPVAEAVKPVAEVVKPVTDAVSPVTDALPVELPVETVTDVLTQAPPLTAPVTDVVTGLVAVPERLPGVELAEIRPIPESAEAPLGLAAGPSLVSALPVHPAVGSPAHFSHTLAPKAADPGAAPKVPAGGNSPSGEGRTPSPDALLPAPASGSGSGTSSGGPSASAAWLNSPFEYLPLMGFVPVSGPLQHVPSPVAISPGSSPD